MLEWIIRFGRFVFVFIFFKNVLLLKAGFALARKFGLVGKGSSKHDPTLETVEKSLARKEKTEQNNRSV